MQTLCLCPQGLENNDYNARTNQHANYMNTEAKKLGPINTMSKKNDIKPILTDRVLFVQARGKFRSPKEFVVGSIPG